MEDQKKELFRIGEVSKLFHISVGILRHYDKMGLLKPEYTDQETGYRYYGIRQFECLNTIRYLRLLDMPLEEIGDFLDNRDTDKMRELLRRQRQEVKRRREELKRIEKRIDNRLEQLEDAALELCMKLPGIAFYGIYRVVFCFLLPYGLMATLPVQSILGELKWQAALQGLAVAAVFTGLTVCAWKRGLRHYNSASS